MKVSSLVVAARETAERLHAKQVDKQGQPYIEHCRRVAEAVEGDEAKAIAWLHDTLEDVLTGADGYLRLMWLLQYEGLPPKQSNNIVRCVNALTRDKSEPYDRYIERLATSAAPVVLSVKLADLRDNLRPCPGVDVSQLHARYLKAIQRLEAADPAQEKG